MEYERNHVFIKKVNVGILSIVKILSIQIFKSFIINIYLKLIRNDELWS